MFKKFSPAAVALLAGHALAQTYTYIGPPNGGWHSASNWSPAGVPGIDPAGVPVVIGPGSPVVLLSGATPSVQSLISASQLRIWVGINIAGNSAITDMDLVGTGIGGFSVGGELLLTGENTLWRSGAIVGTVKNSGVMTFGGNGGNSGYPTVSGSFRNDAACTVAAQIRLQNVSPFENHGTLFVHATIAETSALPGGGGTVKNFSTLGVQPARNGSIIAPFENSGTIAIDTGSLTIEGHRTLLGGTVQLTNGGTLRLYQDSSVSPQPELGCTVSGAGDFMLAGGNIKVAQGSTFNCAPQSVNGLLVELSSGTLTLDASLTNGGKARLKSGRMEGLGAFRNESGATLFWTGMQNAGYMVNRGDIIMESTPFFSDGELYNEAGGTLDLSTGGLALVSGATGKLFNEGTIVRTESSINPVQIAFPLFVRNGSMIQVRKSTLTIPGGGDWSGSSSIQVGPQGGRLIISNGITQITGGQHTVQGTGGTIAVTSTGVLTVSGGQLINQLGTTTSSERFEVLGWLQSQVSEGILNLGQLYVGGGILDGGISSGIRNDGLCVMTPATLIGRMRNLGEVQLAQLNIGIAGNQGGELRNQGFVLHAFGNGSINLLREDSFFRNLDTLEKGAAGLLSINGLGLFDNPGTVRAIAGTIQINTRVQQLVPTRQGNMLSGGNWITVLGGKILLPSGQSVSELGTGTRVRGSSLSTPWMKDVNKVNGTLELDGDIMFMQGMDLFHGARMSIESPAAATVPGGVNNGGPESILDEIEQVFVPSESAGPMLITPVLNNHARMVPGGHSTAGPFNLNGSLVSHPTARMITELAGPDPIVEHDQVVITGSAALDGTLEVRLLGPFVPAAGATFTVLTAGGGITGSFDSVVLTGGPANLSFEALYFPTSVVIRATSACYPNCDGSSTPPVLNVADFACFLQKFAAADPYANCDGSSTPPVLNVADFSCFLQSFAAGCR